MLLGDVGEDQEDNAIELVAVDLNDVAVKLAKLNVITIPR